MIFFLFFFFLLCGNFESETVGWMGFTVFTVFGNWKLKTAGGWAIVSSPSFSFLLFFFSFFNMHIKNDH